MNRHDSNIKKKVGTPASAALSAASQKTPQPEVEKTSMLKAVTSTVQDFAQEAKEAKNYWKGENVHPASYPAPPHYVAALAEIVDTINADHVFEFGCGSGRNLAALMEICTGRPQKCAGVDISSSLIAFGQSQFNLQIEEGDETALQAISDDSYDLVFTVSVLDHLPDPTFALGQLARISKGWCLFIEPYKETLPRQSMRLEKVQNRRGQKNEEDSLPYTYVHDYRALFKRHGLKVAFECSLPTHHGRSGPLYRLWFLHKNAEGAPGLSEPALKSLYDRVLRISFLQLLSNVQTARQAQAKAKAAIDDLRTRLDAANAKYRDVSGSQIPQLKQTIADLKTKLEKATKDRTAAEGKAFQAQQEKTRLEVQIGDLTGKLSQMEESAREKEAKAKALQTRLVESESFHKAANEQLAELKADHKALSRRLVRSERKLGAAAERLKQETNRLETKAQELTGKLSQMEESAREREAKAEALQAENDKLQREIRQTASRIVEVRNQLDHAQRQKALAESQVQKTRNMPAFRLGQALLQAGKSWGGFAALPKRLIKIYRDDKARCLARKTAEGHLLDTRNGKPALSPATRKSPPKIKSFPGEITSGSLKALKIACIMDEFTQACFADEATFKQMSHSKWRDQLEALQPDLLFVESAWRGKDQEWHNLVGRCDKELLGIIEWCRTRKIPTVFWNKEDPIHFATFLNAASLFDYVFTTDVDCIGRYKAALGHDRVYLLPFACQPRRFNPIANLERKNAISFAGAYYTRYPDRNRDLESLIAALGAKYTIYIYDRNFGKDDPNYQFPADYKPFIVGHLPFEKIDEAYKGYDYAINMNSIKQSQSMFARRVFELLGCNTITISNYSRGMRLFFGDLVLSSDEGAEIGRRLEGLGDETARRKFRLAGLRKVMREHTAQDRLAYAVSKVQGKPPPALEPLVLVTAFAKNKQQFDGIYESYKRQNYTNRKLCVIFPNNTKLRLSPKDDTVHVCKAAEVKGKTLKKIGGASAYVAGMVADDYYGPNYLTDLGLAVRYSDAEAIGKATHYVRRRNGVIALARPGSRYRDVKSLAARCALVAMARVGDMPLLEWTKNLSTRRLSGLSALSIDEFNYCKDGVAAAKDRRLCETVNDLSGLDTGADISGLIKRAEATQPEAALSASGPMLTGAELAALFNTSSAKDFSTSVEGNQWRIESRLPDGKHTYTYTKRELKPAELGLSDGGNLYLETTPGLDVQLALIYLDSGKQRLSHQMIESNRDTECSPPTGTACIRLGLRLYGGGQAAIKCLVKGLRSFAPPVVLGKARHLVLTNLYPQYDNLYRNAFVHSRVAAYARRGAPADVFRLNADTPSSYHEFQNVDVITGPPDALDKLLSAGAYESVSVHFLDKTMWKVLERHISRTRVNVWVHGAEIQPFHRREYNMVGLPPDKVKREKTRSERRVAFWRKLLQKMPKNLHLVFVSEFFAKEVMEDLEISIPKNHYSIIHNPVDTGLFAYHKKTAEQRRKILSIRPYASRTYANDLSVAAILDLKNKPFFKELEFRLIGDGALFDKTTKPLRGLSNVTLEKRFLPQAEIAALHREYGICLIPSRMDSQGVSRDEAMSSGLVPVTNKVAAIPEFVDESCARLAKPEDAKGLAAAIEELYENPRLFLKLSKAAAERVRRQSEAGKIITAEMELISGKATRTNPHA